MSRTPFLLLIALAMMTIIRTKPAHADPIGLIEKYALSSNRQEILDQLIPGSEEYFFYHCLHFQVTNQLDKAEALLTQWEQTRRLEGETEQRRAIRDRQRLLTYNSNPQRTIDHLRDRLNIDLEHAAPRVAGQRQWPQQFNNEALDPTTLVGEASRGNRQLTPAGLSLLADQLLRGEGQGIPIDLRWLTQQINGRWYPRLAELVVAELRSRRPEDVRFGDVPAHNYLTFDELLEVRRTFPNLASSDTLTNALLQRLRPSEDADMWQQPDVRLSYLQRVEQFTRDLPEAQNSLKAAAAYRLLEAHYQQGDFPQELFLRYLRLPRQSPIIFVDRKAPQQTRNHPSAAELNADFTRVALLPPIVNEEPLVRAYLEHSFVTAQNTDDFQGLIESGYLARVFAETKLLAGIGDPQRWYESIPTAQRAPLTERVELTLAPTNPRLSDLSRNAELIVDIKNVDELIVRVYEINSQAYYRENNDPIDTNIDLDGLVATDEQRIKYEHPAIRRHRETIPLTSIQGRGVWVIDLLGGGLRARAILRRGDLRFIEQWTPNGHQFVVLDQDRQPVQSAQMLLGSKLLVADDEGKIVVPPVDRMLTRQAVLMDNELAVPVLFDHRSEDYTLSAGFVLNRQQLRSGQLADLIIRPQLQLGEQTADPAMAKDANLTIIATDQDGISTTKRFEDLKLSETAETVVRFRTPSRLSNIQVTLSAKLTLLATGREIDLSDSRLWKLNEINNSSRTSDLHVTRRGDDWVIEVRGLNGELIPGAVVSISLQSSYRGQPIEATLESGDDGTILLGPLPGVNTITMTGSDGVPQYRSLQLADAVWPQRLHGTSNETLTLPLKNPSAEVGKNFFLHAVVSGAIVADFTQDKLTIENGLLKIQPLTGGDYRLLSIADGQVRETSLSITDGPVVNQVAAGQIRNLELRWPGAVSVANIERNNDGLKIQLAGDTSLARVHIVGSRYLPEDDPISFHTPSPGSRGVDLAENGYVSDLRLGEEYLYVLRRQYAKKYPGVMLPQPSLLLNPWVTEETKNAQQNAAPGDAVPDTDAAPAPAMEAEGLAEKMARSAGQTQSQNLDFLPDGGVMLTNLRPDENGVIQISSDLLGASPLLHILVVDPMTTVQRTAIAPLPSVDTRDLRLASPLPKTTPYTFQRSVLVAGPNAPLDMQSIGSAQIQAYTNVVELLQLFRTISGDPRLDEFLPLGRWHSLDLDTKRSIYGRLACHELNIFIKAKDPQFFQQVVRPYLENKQEKQLVDHWLLDRDLTPWTDMWQYARLNAFEKALLARSVPAMRAAVIREMQERIANAPVDTDQLRRLVEYGLAGDKMSEMAAFSKLSLGDEAAEGAAFGGGGYVFFAEDGIAASAESRAKGTERSFDVPAGPAGGMGGGGMGGIGVGNAPTRGGRMQRRSLGRSPGARGIEFFQQIDSTKQWSENHWDHVRVAQANENLIPIDPFWLAWIETNDQATFLTEHLLRPSDNRHAVLVALAILGLPLEGQSTELPSGDDTVYQPGTPVAIVTKRLTKIDRTRDDASILVGQRFQAVHQTSSDDTDEVKIAPDEFLTGVAYTGQIVLTNPTPKRQTVDCFWQVPAGSMPLAGSQATDSETVVIEPFQVRMLEYQFYFPSVGTFEHYPVCVSSDNQVVARGIERSFVVLDQPSKIDETSWEQIAQSGSAEKMGPFLRQANLRKLDLNLVAHRLRERAIYDVVIGVLEDARLWQSELWGYALLHRDAPRIKTYLEQRSDFVAVVGPVLNSPIMTVQPVQRGLYEHLEYAPLVPARIHPLRTEPEILNDRFLQQYRTLMRVIAYQPAANAQQQLALTYYLLLQNRIEEAIDYLQSVDRGQVETDLQYDYLVAYIAFHQANYALAAETAQRHANHPVPRWRERFNDVLSQLSQRRDLVSGAQLVRGNDEGKPGDHNGVRTDAADLAVMDRERRQADGAQSAPDVRVRVEGDRLVIDYRNADEATLKFYGVDLELLFSKTPMIQQGLQRMAIVAPGRTEKIALGQGSGSVSYQLDETLARQTLLVEVVSSSARDTTLYYGGKLRSYVSEGFGQLQVSDRTSGEPVATAYVKVYTKGKDGSVTFYKDGYTDLRGRFDYATLSTGDLGQIDRFAILVLDEERGATLHEVAPPTR